MLGIGIVYKNVPEEVAGKVYLVYITFSFIVVPIEIVNNLFELQQL